MIIQSLLATQNAFLVLLPRNQSSVLGMWERCQLHQVSVPAALTSGHVALLWPMRSRLCLGFLQKLGCIFIGFTSYGFYSFLLPRIGRKIHCSNYLEIALMKTKQAGTEGRIKSPQSLIADPYCRHMDQVQVIVCLGMGREVIKPITANTVEGETVQNTLKLLKIPVSTGHLQMGHRASRIPV